MSTKHLKAVTFDVGGTLINPWPSVGHVYAEVAERFGIAVRPEAINAGFNDAWKSRHNFDYSREGWFEIVRQSFREEGGELPPEFFPAVYRRFADPEVWIVFGDVLHTLEELAARDLKLAIISNWDERLIPLLTALGLRQYFEGVFVSCNVGFTKPSPVIFEHAVRWLKVRPGETLHVGDSEHEDVRGARTCRMQSLWLRRGKTVDGPDQISTLKALLPLLAGRGMPCKFPD